MALASSSSSSRCCVVDPERVITELSRGREIADRLRLILRDDSVVFSAHTHTLVNQLLDTFTHSLTMLQIPSEDCKTPPPPPKDRRGCYKRKYVPSVNNAFQFSSIYKLISCFPLIRLA